MKRCWIFLIVAMVGGVVTGFHSRGTKAHAGDLIAPSIVVGTLPAYAGEGGSYTYVGSGACKKCHIKEHKSWAATKMGKAFETLKPGQAKEAKEKFKLDPNKDYSKDATCVKCHVTGHGKPGGYAIPAEGNEQAAKDSAKLENVGCESCHGPGSEYIKVFEEITKSKRKYKVDELYKVGLAKIEASTCTACHNKDGPTVDPAKPFDYEKQKEEGLHERVPLKDREG